MLVITRLRHVRAEEAGVPLEQVLPLGHRAAWGTAISFAPSHRVNPLANRLPRCGVPIVTTRWIGRVRLRRRRAPKGNCFVSEVGVRSSRNWRSLTMPPEVVPAVDRLQAREQPAHAVADQDRLVERSVLLPAGIERADRIRSTKSWRSCASADPERVPGSGRGRTRTGTAVRMRGIGRGGR